MKLVDLRHANGTVEVADRSPTYVYCESRTGKKCWGGMLALMCCGIGRPGVVECTEEEVSPSVVMGRQVTGTIYGSRKGRVTFCLQEDPRAPPLLLLEFAMPTYSFVKEMSSGMLRIALECEKSDDEFGGRSPDLLSEPVWSLYCNGRKVGFAIKRLSSEADRKILQLMHGVTMGAGVIPSPVKKIFPSPDDELMYMRARYERVGGRSPDSLSFHLINPDGSPGQELSVFLFRS